MVVMVGTRQGLCTPLSPSSVLYSVLPTSCAYATCLGLRVFVVLDRTVHVFSPVAPRRRVVRVVVLRVVP